MWAGWRSASAPQRAQLDPACTSSSQSIQLITREKARARRRDPNRAGLLEQQGRTHIRSSEWSRIPRFSIPTVQHPYLLLRKRRGCEAQVQRHASPCWGLAECRERRSSAAPSDHADVGAAIWIAHEGARWAIRELQSAILREPSCPALSPRRSFNIMQNRRVAAQSQVKLPDFVKRLEQALYEASSSQVSLGRGRYRARGRTLSP